MKLAIVRWKNKLCRSQFGTGQIIAMRSNSESRVPMLGTQGCNSPIGMSGQYVRSIEGGKEADVHKSSTAQCRKDKKTDLGN